MLLLISLAIGWLTLGFLLGLWAVKITFDNLTALYPSVERKSFWNWLGWEDVPILVFSAFIGPVSIIGVVICSSDK